MASRRLGSRHIVILMLGVGLLFILFIDLHGDNISTAFKASISNYSKLDIQLPSCPKPSCPKAKTCSTLPVDQRRRLAATVAEVQRQIQRLAGTGAHIDAKWALKLASVAGELDPRISLVNESWDYSARLPNMGPAPKLPKQTRHVCPEMYQGPKYNRPFGQQGMEPEKCSYVPKFSSVLTAILSASNWKSNMTNFVVKQIRKHYDIPIIAIVSPGDKIDENIKNVTVIKHDKDKNEAEALNTAVKKVKTPYVFMGKSLTHFDKQSSLERLVRILDELEHVKVAGGAARDLQGHWIHGCLQQRMANYQAYYAMGYYHSKYECMYCDDLLASFVTTTKLIIDIPLTKGLSGPAVYRDWFAKVRQEGHLTMVCPDVMFYVSNHTTMDKEDWLIMGKKWALEKVRSYDGQLYNFTCDSIGISCNTFKSIIKSYLLPLCCRALIEKYISYITNYGKQHNLPFELQYGSALGALKMDGYLPWDYDTDIAIECKDYEMWLNITKFMVNKHCKVWIRIQNVHIKIDCPYFLLELYCNRYNTTSRQFLPSKYQNTPTTINYSGTDIIVSANPGLHCRNLIGIEDLKHAAHYLTLKVSKVGEAKGGYDNPGTWNRCKNQKHHSCLDHYPGDGNLPFEQPFIQL